MDENSCAWSWYYTVFPLIIAYLIVTVSWCFTYFNAYFTIILPFKDKKVDGRKNKIQRIISVEEPYINSKMREIKDNFGTEDIFKLERKKLADLKVILFYFYD